MPNHPIVRISLLVLVLLLSFAFARADISEKQARKAIAKAGGLLLSSSSIRIEKIAATEASSAEVSTELELVFRLALDEREQWRIYEVRTGDGTWDSVDAIARSLKVDLQQDACGTNDLNGRLKPQSKLTNQLARCLVADLFSISLPSDAVRIKETSALSLGPNPSALVVSLVRGDFRLAKDTSGWRAVAFRSGTRPWASFESLPGGLDSIKRERTTEQLNALASALELYKRDNGFFVVSDKHAVLIDHLAPHYLTRVLRVDSWHRPFRYQGDRDHFTLRSLGPDGKENTADDIVVSK